MTAAWVFVALLALAALTLRWLVHRQERGVLPHGVQRVVSDHAAWRARWLRECAERRRERSVR